MEKAAARNPADAITEPTTVTLRQPYLQIMFVRADLLWKIFIYGPLQSGSRNRAKKGGHLSQSQVAAGPERRGRAWKTETTPATLALLQSNSFWNSSNMTPKLKVTPSAIMLTKKEAATTTQPKPPSGAPGRLVVVEEVAEETLVHDTVDVSEAVRQRFFFPLGLFRLVDGLTGSAN